MNDNESCPHGQLQWRGAVEIGNASITIKTAEEILLERIIKLEQDVEELKECIINE